jgi:hypothetical protein
MKHRKLRIAWSVTWGIVAVLLIVLWVRSYYYCDRLYGVQSDGWNTYVLSSFGELILQRSPVSAGLPPTPMEYSGKSQTQSRDGWLAEHYPAESGFKLPDLYGWYSSATLTRVDVQYSCVAIVCAVIAILPWTIVRWRFTLRTLLIATTLIAIALTVIVWLD